MPIIQSQYKPAWWLRNPHAQTLWSTLARLRPKAKIEWQRLELADGDFIDLAWSGPKEGRTVLLLHGLEGSINSKYASGLMRELGQRGYRTCLMHFRGCSGEPNRLPRCYHFGETKDPQYVLEYLRDQMGIKLYAAVGFSLGGNVLLKWLGEQGTASPLQRAAVMSVPFRLEHIANRINTGFSRIYQRHLLGSLRRSYKARFARIASPLNADIERLDTFWLFDDQVTAPLHGFTGVDDYYSQASSHRFLSQITVPTLVLHASDDPFMYSHTAPSADELSEDVYLEVAPQGGHVGFISGMLPGWANYWGEQRLAEWIDGG